MQNSLNCPGARTARWTVPLAAALMLISLGVIAGRAGAATTATPPGTTPTRPGGAVGGFQPGGLILQQGVSSGGASSGSAAAGRSIRNRGTASTNWSGYALTGGAGAFTSVSASWTEPTATCGSGTQYAAFWVGLAGYNSDSVEASGTDSACNGGTPVYYGWYEMSPASPVYFTNPVAPGDRLSAAISVSGTSYTLTLTDSTQGWTQTENESGRYADSSAEVITEAPASAQGALPLADFGAINYSASSVDGTSLGAQNPTSITMIGASGDQLDSTSAIGESGDFSNPWEAAS